MRTPFKPGDLIDATIKGVRILGLNALTGAPTIADEHGDEYPMPPQAAIKSAGQGGPADAAALQERISKALGAIDDWADNHTLDPWTANWLRKTLDPNPRRWPPQAGDVWDDGLPFGGSLWFARRYPAKPDDPDQTPKIAMVSVVGEAASHTPRRLLELHPEIRLVYRRKDGSQ